MKSLPKSSVVSPLLDFFLLGGASLIIFPLVIVFFPSKILESLKILPFFLISVVMLEYVCNFPHFAYSYQLMYKNFGGKLSGDVDPTLRNRYILAGVIVPTVMIVLFAVVYLQRSTVLLQYAVNIMLLTAGWHYAKQGFGILIVASVYKKVFYGVWERRILLWNAHLLWIYAWIMYNTGIKEKVYFGVTFLTIGFSRHILDFFTFLVLLSSFIFLGVIVRRILTGLKNISFNGFTAYIASVYLWVILLFGHGVDNAIHPLVLLIPFMHSLQYMTIVLRMKENEVNHRLISRTTFVIFSVLAVLIGAVIFDLLPKYLDRSIVYDQSVYGPTLFMSLFWIFINIHHYFIDNVIWRREGSEVKNYLFSVAK